MISVTNLRFSVDIDSGKRNKELVTYLQENVSPMKSAALFGILVVFKPFDFNKRRAYTYL